MFGRKKKKNGMEYNDNASTINSNTKVSNIHEATLICANDYPDICAIATSVCWDTPIPEGLENRLAYVEKRVKSGHESVIEHSNMIFYISCDRNQSDDLFEFTAHANYLRIRPKLVGNTYHILVGGSIRGYKDALSECIYRHLERNYMVRTIMILLYRYSFKEYFADLIKYEVMNEKSFTGTDQCFNPCKSIVLNEKVSILNIDSPVDILNKANDCARDSSNPAGTFDMDDVFDVSSVTVLFDHMSRTATHQQVRHRNAITQESQRYVDYSNAHFVNPADFKSDKYNPGNKYSILFGGHRMEFTLKELGDELQRVYPQLIKPYLNQAPGLLKEDARSFLPSNVESKLYMTFTWSNLFKYLDLRTAKAAQVEIRSYAIELEKYICERKFNWRYYALPKFKRRLVEAPEAPVTDLSSIDEPIGDAVEEVISETTADTNGFINKSSITDNY